MKNFNCRKSSVSGQCLMDLNRYIECNGDCILFGKCMNCFYNLVYGDKNDICKDCRNIGIEKVKLIRYHKIRELFFMKECSRLWEKYFNKKERQL